jgi:ABC-type Fe3+/spermidine/putrescine transport system ATPase subunit
VRRGGDAVSPSGVSFVASFLGRTNLLDAVFLGCKDQALELDVEGQLVSIKAATAGEPCHAVRVMMRPEAIGIGFPGDSLTATVVSSTYLGDKVECVVRLTSQTLQILRFNPPENERLLPGSRVSVSLPTEGIQLLLPN